MNNIKTIISNHNKAEISKPTHNDEENKNCNCRKPNTCPMDGSCNAQNIVYQAEATTPTTRETYIGLCDTTFKLRYRNHICSFRNERYRNVTELSKHVWNLKDQNIKFDIKRRKVKQARSYSNVTKGPFTWKEVFPGFVYMRGRVTLGGGLPYLLARVTLLEGTTFCLFKPCKRSR